MLFEHLRATRELLWQRNIGKKRLSFTILLVPT